MNKIILGILLGSVAGIIDVVPMVLQKLSWNANISAFFLWVVTGFMIATSSLPLHPIIKGILISFLILLPSLFIIVSNGLKPLIPIFIMTTFLGGLLGFFIG